jgi:hypothetical protein
VSVVTAGESICPICSVFWIVTPMRDCLMPACGCFGHDFSEANLSRPCEPCGIQHALNCPRMP